MDDTITRSIANRLKSLRETSLGFISANKLADELHKEYGIRLTERQIYNNEKYGRISHEELEAYANYFNVSKEYILGLTDSKSKKINPNINSVSQYLDLNYDSIKALKNTLPEFRTVLNAIIQDKHFAMLLSEISNYFDIPNKEELIEISLGDKELRGDSIRVLARSYLDNMHYIVDQIKEAQKNSHPKK